MQAAKQRIQATAVRRGRADRLRTRGRRGPTRARRRVHLGEKAHQGVKTGSSAQVSGNKRVRCGTAPGHLYFVFDTRNQLLRVEDDGTPVGTYQYDAFGLRVTKTTAEGTSQYTYDEQSVLLRRGPDGEQKFEYGPDRLLSVNDSNLGRAYYLFDGLGSVTNLTTEAGTLLAQYRWDAWGNIREQTDTAANPFGFTGHEMDDESGLVYAKARFYDPVTGRFLSHDPVEGDPSNPPSLHRYLYAFQNPTVFVDPDGRMPEEAQRTELTEEEIDEIFANLISRDTTASEPAANGEEEEAKPGLFDRVKNFFTEKIRDARESAGETIEEAKRLNDKLDEGLRSQQGPSPEEQASLSGTVGSNSSDLQIIKESTEQAAVVVEKAAETTGDAIEAGERVSILGLFRGLFRRGAKKAAREVSEEGSEELVEQTASRRGRQAAARGAAREERVAELTGGKVSREEIKTPFGRTDLDVVGPNGELISVGGPAKSINPGKFGGELKKLESEAEARGVQVLVYLERGTPQEVIDLARRKVGKDNVVVFDP